MHGFYFLKNQFKDLVSRYSDLSSSICNPLLSSYGGVASALRILSELLFPERAGCWLQSNGIWDHWRIV